MPIYAWVDQSIAQSSRYHKQIFLLLMQRNILVFITIFYKTKKYRSKKKIKACGMDDGVILQLVAIKLPEGFLSLNYIWWCALSAFIKPLEASSI